MEDFNRNDNELDNQSRNDHHDFRRNGRPGMKMGRPNGQNRPPRDRQKGMVCAFVLGKGQNAALKWLMETRTPVCIFLITGVKFEGLVSAFDAFTISITDVKRHQQMIYKDKISTITVKKPESQGHGAPHRPRREDGFSSSSEAENGITHPLRDGQDASADDGVTLPPRNLHSTDDYQ